MLSASGGGRPRSSRASPMEGVYRDLRGANNSWDSPIMLGNPFEGRYDPLPPALAKRGFAQHLARVADDVTLSYIRGPAHGKPLLVVDRKSVV